MSVEFAVMIEGVFQKVYDYIFQEVFSVHVIEIWWYYRKIFSMEESYQVITESDGIRPPVNAYSMFSGAKDRLLALSSALS